MAPKRCHTSQESGFSLLEVLCAVMVMGISLLGLVEALTLTLRYSQDEAYYNTAVRLATSHMEEFRADGYVIAGEDEGDFEPEFPQWSWTQSVEEAELPGLFNVVIQVRRAEEELPTYELHTQLFEAPLGP